jgi:hypothetical protein
VPKLHGTDLEKWGLGHRQVFVETGTQWGLRTKCFAYLFEQVHTVEIDPEMYAVVSRKLKRFPNITCHLGDSPEVLRRVLDPAKSTTLFLDAHYVGTSPSPGQCERQCPLMDELDAIVSLRWTAPHAIIIDDAIMFQDWWWKRLKATRYDRRQWPTLRAIKQALKGYDFRQVGNMYIAEPA